MNRLTQFLLVRRPGLNGHWWHRLANVLIYGSTVAIFLLLVIFALPEGNWTQISFTAYSFEGGYSAAAGVPTPCSFTANPLNVGIYGFLVHPEISCGDINDSWTFLYQYVNAHPGYRGLTINNFDLFLNGSSISKSDADVVMNSAIQSGDLSSIFAKKETKILWGSDLTKILVLIAITLVWFVFWEAIIYRAFVYIVLGGRKTGDKD